MKAVTESVALFLIQSTKNQNHVKGNLGLIYGNNDLGEVNKLIDNLYDRSKSSRPPPGPA